MPWMVPPQKRSPQTVYNKIICPPGLNIATHAVDDPAVDGPTLGMAFQASVVPEKWIRKDKAVYTVRVFMMS